MSQILRYANPISILSGTIIGAGMFSLPFVFERAGFFLGLAYLLFFTFVFYITHSMYADIMLRTEKLPGFSIYAREYLGAWAVLPAAIATVLGILLTSTIYLVLSFSFARLVLPGIPEELIVYPFWFLGSLGIFLKIKRIATLEFLVIFSMAAILGVIFFLSLLFGKFDAHNFVFAPESMMLFFLPFGPALFSLSGRSAIPALIADAKENKISTSHLPSIIFYGTAIPSVFYLAFVLSIWGLSGVVSEDAVSGISYGGNTLIRILGLIGIASLFKTYIPINLSVKNILETDFGFSHFRSGLFVVFVPIIIYLTKVSFLDLVNIVGGFFLATESIIIALIWVKLNKINKPRILIKKFGNRTAYIIIAIFVIGLISEFLYS